MDTEGWTLDELARRAGQALAADAVRAPNGRVRERPDGRAIRWYSTIGLVDRPFTGPGRAARYGPRHLLQLVAVKRLQALGRSLAEIQAELTGATEATLRRIADLPEDGVEPAHDAATPAEAATVAAPARFWAARPGPVSVATPFAPSAPALEPAPAPPSAPVPSPPAKEAAAPEPEPVPGIPIAVRYELALSDTVSLTIPTLPDPADLAALREAAAPLLHLLGTRGLTSVQGVHDEY